MRTIKTKADLEWLQKGQVFSATFMSFLEDVLTSAGVQANAVKLNATTFKIVVKKANITLTISGANKTDFFSN